MPGFFKKKHVSQGKDKRGWGTGRDERIVKQMREKKNGGELNRDTCQLFC